MTVLSGTYVPDFGYAGYYLHQPTDLNFTVFRAYDPELGQWISRDPIGERGGVRLHGYAGGDPINYVDPSGKIFVEPVLGGFAGDLAFPDFSHVVPQKWAAWGAVIAGAWALDKIIEIAFDAADESCPDNSEPDCEKIKDQCIDTCSETALPTSDYGFKFWNCLNACMAQNGC